MQLISGEMNGRMNGDTVGFAVHLGKNGILNGRMNGGAAGFAVHLG